MKTARAGLNKTLPQKRVSLNSLSPAMRLQGSHGCNRDWQAAYRAIPGILAPLLALFR
jgi:hypothetical protein